ncbi:MAG: arylesterase [Candidatus Sedimenticola sp. (ex Thyasira tokunagai)]
MKRLLLILLLLSGICRAESPVILVLGDSLSAAHGIAQSTGWVNLLQLRLQEEGYPHRVANASISGETTVGGLNRLPALLVQHQPQIMIVALGGNDGLRGLSFGRMRDNLLQIVQLGQKRNSRVLLLGIMLPPNYGKAFNDKFLAVFPEIVGQTDIPLVPFFLQGVADRPEWMQMDGLHPNRFGQPRVLENVWEKLETLLK